jgi:transposase-like protein
MDRTPETLLEAVTYFSDPDRAHEYAVQMRWPNGVACPRHGCGSASVQFIATRKLWRCKECKRQFSVRVGTVFEDSPIPFTKWLPAFWLLSNTKNGTSSCELARHLKVSQKTAWFMLHRVREAMATRSFERKLQGEVEADETFIGGNPKFKHGNIGRQVTGVRHGPKWTDKTVVFGMIERGGTVRAMTVPNTKMRTLMPKLREHVRGGSTVYTDASLSYSDAQWSYNHLFVDHAVRYVEGRVSTNRIENFWSCVKRTLHGTYIAVRPFHLDAYLDESVFRFNARDDNDAGRFVSTLKGADGKRLTYKALTSSHPRWRERPIAAMVPRRRKVDEPPIPGVSDRVQ